MNPTVLNPLYVVQRMHYEKITKLLEDYGDTEVDIHVTVVPEPEFSNGMEYYCAAEEGSRPFLAQKTRALLFSSLQSARSVAEAEVAEVRVLTSQEEAREFGR